MEEPAVSDLRSRIDPDIRRGLDRLLAIVGPDGLSGLDIQQRRKVQAEIKAMRPPPPPAARDPQI